MKKLNKILFIAVLSLSFSFFVGSVSAVTTQKYLDRCDVVVKKAECIKAVKACATDACADLKSKNPAITGGVVTSICKTVSNPQACNTAYVNKCKQFAGQRTQLAKCEADIKSQFGGGSAGTGSDAGGGSIDQGTTLPGSPANLNSKGAKKAEYQCGVGESAMKTQIDLGCLGKKGNLGAIEDLALAIVRLLTYGVGIVLVGSIIYAGITYSASTGNPEQTQKAKNRVRDAIIALVFYLLIGALMQFLVPGGFFG